MNITSSFNQFLNTTSQALSSVNVTGLANQAKDIALNNPLTSIGIGSGAALGTALLGYSCMRSSSPSQALDNTSDNLTRDISNTESTPTTLTQEPEKPAETVTKSSASATQISEDTSAQDNSSQSSGLDNKVSKLKQERPHLGSHPTYLNVMANLHPVGRDLRV